MQHLNRGEPLHITSAHGSVCRVLDLPAMPAISRLPDGLVFRCYSLTRNIALVSRAPADSCGRLGRSRVYFSFELAVYTRRMYWIKREQRMIRESRYSRYASLDYKRAALQRLIPASWSAASSISSAPLRHPHAPYCKSRRCLPILMSILDAPTTFALSAPPVHSQGLWTTCQPETTASSDLSMHAQNWVRRRY